MRDNEMLYSVLAVCVTVLLIAIGYFSHKTDEKRIDLFVECLYSSDGVVDPIDRCRQEVPRIIRWEDEDELEEPEDLMDGGK